MSGSQGTSPAQRPLSTVFTPHSYPNYHHPQTRAGPETLYDACAFDKDAFVDVEPYNNLRYLLPMPNFEHCLQGYSGNVFTPNGCNLPPRCGTSVPIKVVTGVFLDTFLCVGLPLELVHLPNGQYQHGRNWYFLERMYAGTEHLAPFINTGQLLLGYNAYNETVLVSEHIVNKTFAMDPAGLIYAPREITNLDKRACYPTPTDTNEYRHILCFGGPNESLRDLYCKCRLPLSTATSKAYVPGRKLVLSDAVAVHITAKGGTTFQVDYEANPLLKTIRCRANYQTSNTLNAYLLFFGNILVHAVLSLLFEVFYLLENLVQMIFDALGIGFTPLLHLSFVISVYMTLKFPIFANPYFFFLLTYVLYEVLVVLLRGGTVTTTS